ncbi:MAG: hypothetical protein FWD71_07300 [Oscillospiraceae bacterium]|nr:hypothetical protein [Oscillospiraceae bacterium]
MKKVKEQNLVYADKEIFKKIAEKIDSEKFDSSDNEENTESVAGIGTLGEKKLHKILKYYFEPDKKYHEIKVGGYFADVCKDNIIIEIHTGSFGSIRDKIKYYLENRKEYKITFVHPIAAIRHMCWVNKNTGEASKISNSPKFIDIYKFYEQIYYIKDFIADENFNLKLLLMEITEYKFLDGWGKSKKNNATKIDKIPISVVGEENFSGKNDYLKFIPSELKDGRGFTANDLKDESGIKGRPVYSFIKVMKETGLISENGKRGRSVRYDINNAK